MLLAAMFMLAVLTISLTVAVPAVRKSIQRDHDIETLHRGKQYARAIQLYYRKFGAYPVSVDALVGTNGIRFLRQRYLDPTTGKDDWKPILLGQNKTPLAMGFFGQPLGMSTNPLAGQVAGSGNGISGATSAFGAGTGSNSSGTSFSDSGGANTAGGTDPGSGSNSGSGSNTDGQTFGGGPIIGFSPASPKQSIYVYKKMDHYNGWEFLYSPISDQMVNGNMVNQPPLQGGAPGAPPPITQSAPSNSSPQP